MPMKNNVIKRSLSQTLVVLACTILLAACNSTDTTTPTPTAPTFDYSSDDLALKSYMQQFAYQMQLLHWAMNENPDNPSAQQQEVLTILRQLETIADNVESVENKTSHPFLENYLNDFNIRLDHAVTAAESNPPSYYLAGQIAGGCISCHWVRDKSKMNDM